MICNGPRTTRERHAADSTHRHPGEPPSPHPTQPLCSATSRERSSTRHIRFEYPCAQKSFDPISHRISCSIHFEFRDGTRRKDAFVYDWRLWTLPDLRELMADAGFEDVHVLWEGTLGETRSGNGVFRRKEVGDVDSAWIVYVVGRKPKGRVARRG